ncbi:50S ribosomal protein L31e [Saccharolobus islandicus]|jgi:large subunit ribosomal protein L31e|uniref:Large ribosomal subunit protein eL31 n=3 Tax=Saccharolobus islandicus TaxID=43080 RepID=M9UAI0_SACIS|nr:50S ribosomal protein L31e [Sulfolobus islandicus]ADX83077.1 ribosomal protein L31E (rpl31E) [Sulfolobus islandicus HVE10/4]ADX85714.1 ribosomal protein L31E (rpl31E) [Sulfolobus islandicus REY15A]AGJ63088.1 50S ribosomal protein L31e [Sulfolobus islandicus LAL14/1]WCM38143.1 50S ribosomal protein L31e [Sulfolobus islandicus]
MKEKDNFEMVINLRKIKTGKRTGRSKRAVKFVRKIVTRHFNADKVVIDPLLAKSISKNGNDKVVSKVRVVVSKVGEKIYLVRLAIKSR